MRPTVSQYVQALTELTDDVSVDRVSEIAEHFWGLLRQTGTLRDIPAIIKGLEQREADRKNQLAVTILTAHPARPETRHTLTTKANQLFPGQVLMVRFDVDARLIGGALFRTNEVVYDMTLVRETQQLKTSLLTI
ncbi:MAG: F0F1 ATP synthase subunit delta [Minisyncoccota bacterium]